MTGRPAALSRLTNSILSAVETARCLVLQAVARSDFDDRHSSLSEQISTESTVVWLHELALAAVDRRDRAVAGARSGSSIFIASSTTTVSPFSPRRRA